MVYSHCLSPGQGPGPGQGQGPGWVNVNQWNTFRTWRNGYLKVFHWLTLTHPGPCPCPGPGPGPGERQCEYTISVHQWEHFQDLKNGNQTQFFRSWKCFHWLILTLPGPCPCPGLCPCPGPCPRERQCEYIRTESSRPLSRSLFLRETVWIHPTRWWCQWGRGACEQVWTGLRWRPPDVTGRGLGTKWTILTGQMSNVW